MGVVTDHDTLVPALRLPEWAISLLAFFLILGFPIAVLLAWAYEITPEGVKRDKDVHRDSSIAHVTGRKLDLAIIGVLIIAVIYFALDKYILSPSRPIDESTVNGELIATQRSIAVLPFLNLSSDPEQGYFANERAKQAPDGAQGLDEVMQEGLRAIAEEKGFTFED